jgi:hypothetical protein
LIAASGAPTDITATSLVLVGAYDPTLLQPANLLKTGALTESDLSELRYELLAPEVTVAKLPWVRAVAERDRLVFATTIEAPAAEPVRDFLLDVVELQPIKRFTALGINSEYHFGVASSEIWHNTGHRLAPKDDLWNKILKEPGTLSITIQGVRDDGARGNVNIKVEPSARIQPGIFVQINDHFEADPATLANKPDQLLRYLTVEWPVVMKRADQVLTAVKEFAK